MINFLRQTKASVAVEFALTAPLAVLLLAATLETTRIQIVSMILERSAYDIAYQSKVAMGEGFENIVASVVAKRLNGVFSTSDIIVTATSSPYPDELLSQDATIGAGAQGDVVKLNLRAEIGVFNKLVPKPFKIVRYINFYYINEINKMVDND
ncbi:MAG: pilus assembly protein [Deltaproteobacteria bacterium]|jgi:hypothetical protein|nr:pilus assembly protein [Deltaproteobacteria bacterium]